MVRLDSTCSPLEGLSRRALSASQVCARPGVNVREHTSISFLVFSFHPSIWISKINSLGIGNQFCPQGRMTLPYTRRNALQGSARMGKRDLERRRELGCVRRWCERSGRTWSGNARSVAVEGAAVVGHGDGGAVSETASPCHCSRGSGVLCSSRPNRGLPPP